MISLKSLCFTAVVIALPILFQACDSEEPVVLTDAELLELEIAQIAQYFEDSNLMPEVDSSGIHYIITNEGDGSIPEANQNVVVKYEGYFLDGTRFDLNTEGIEFDLSGLIEAWKIMIPQMREGEKRTFVAPSSLCYGRRGNNFIPSNSVLAFDIELMAIARPFDEQLAIDLEKIDNYLEAESITASKHSSGIRFILSETGEGISPTLNDLINVNFTGEFFDGSLFAPEESIGLRLNSAIVAWQTMVPLMKEGDKIVIYAPSVYCYGSIGNEIIPPNTNLIFEIDLVSVN